MSNDITQLCELLSERGIGYTEQASEVIDYECDGVTYRAFGYDGGIRIKNMTPMSPSAVVDMTVGQTVTEDTSDGWHSFKDLYHHRAVLFSVIVHDYSALAWKSKKHHDGTMYDGMFIVGIDTPEGQATYHYDVDPYWDMFDCKELACAPRWDGHTPDEAIARIGSLASITDYSDMRMDDECDEYPQGRWWRCETCGQRFLYERGFKPHYCPECGRTRRHDQ